MRCDNTYHGNLLICEKEMWHDGPCEATEPASSQSAVNARPGPPPHRVWYGRFPKKPVDPEYEEACLRRQREDHSPGRISAAEMRELLKFGEAA